jgi:hypothetical protein
MGQTPNKRCQLVNVYFSTVKLGSGRSAFGHVHASGTIDSYCESPSVYIDEYG